MENYSVEDVISYSNAYSLGERFNEQIRAYYNEQYNDSEE